MVNRWGSNGNSYRLYFLGLKKITVDSDYSHENKRCLFLERKPMTNPGSILKSRDITFPTKVHIVKVTVFPVVTYECESWIIKKAEHRRIGAFELWSWRKLLTLALDCKKIRPVNPKGNQPWISLEGLMLKLKLQYFGHLMWRAHSLEKAVICCQTWFSDSKITRKILWSLLRADHAPPSHHSPLPCPLLLLICRKIIPF